jgi:uncharacterized BrkB/YihY/UPF0761 family membrane protein
VNEQTDADARWYSKSIKRGQQYQEKLERYPWVAFALQSVRRFNKIEGKHLALVIALNLFVAVIPLVIIGYAFIEAFNPHRDVGNVLVGNLHLTGRTATIVEDTFTNASSGKSAALSISLISLLITGLDVSATAQIAYARAFGMTPLRGVQKYLRGAAWLVLLLADTGFALTLRDLATHHPIGFAIGAGAVLVVLEFGFFLVTPRLLLDLPFKWRELVPGAAVCTVAAVIVHTVLSFFLRNWFGEYGHAYGGFGISLALVAAVGIIASFWVWIAAVMGVYWERKAGSAAVAKMEELSAEISVSHAARDKTALEVTERALNQGPPRSVPGATVLVRDAGMTSPRLGSRRFSRPSEWTSCASQLDQHRGRRGHIAGRRPGGPLLLPRRAS